MAEFLKIQRLTTIRSRCFFNTRLFFSGCNSAVVFIALFYGFRITRRDVFLTGNISVFSVQSILRSRATAKDESAIKFCVFAAKEIL
jgi:hypothetical protein